MRVYVTVRLRGTCAICPLVRTCMESVPEVLVASSPCAKFLNDHVCDKSGSLMSCLYLEIDSPVTGCMTGAQKFSPTQGMACEVGMVVYG